MITYLCGQCGEESKHPFPREGVKQGVTKFTCPKCGTEGVIDEVILKVKREP